MHFFTGGHMTKIVIVRVQATVKSLFLFIWNGDIINT